MYRYVVFDMDNTLIDTNPLYRNASAEFAKYMLDLGLGYEMSLQQIIKRQDEIDVELFKNYGYSADRFAESFVQTAGELISFARNFKEIPINIEFNIKQQSKNIALKVFSTDAQEFPEVIGVMRDLLILDYKIGLITAGDYDVQNKRISRLSCRNLFSEIWVVPDKNKNVYTDFLMKTGAVNAWMIGDSLRSDIIPAMEAGFKVIHINNDNWKSVEHKQLNKEVPTINKLTDIWEFVPWQNL